MKTSLLLQVLLINLPLLVFNAVEGFAPLSSNKCTVVYNSPLLHPYSKSYRNTNKSIFQRSASQDDNSMRKQAEGESEAKVNDDADTDAANDADDNDELDDYDFEAGFQARLQKEGGRTGVQVKAAKRSVNSVTRDVTGSVQSNVKKSRNNLSLLSTSEWFLTVGVLVLVVVLAVGTHVTGTSTESFEPIFGSTEPFETTSNGEQLGFGGR